MEIKKENIIVLCYSQNSCCTSVVKLTDSEKQFSNLELDLSNNKWRFKDGEYNNNQFWNIGRCRYVANGKHFGVIGLYDMTNLEHLNMMAAHSQSATSEPSYGDD